MLKPNYTKLAHHPSLKLIALSLNLLLIISFWSEIYFFKALESSVNIDSDNRIALFQNYGIRLFDELGASLLIWLLDFLSGGLTPESVQLTLGIVFSVLYLVLLTKSKMYLIGLFITITPFFLLQATNIQPFGIAAVLALIGLLGASDQNSSKVGVLAILFIALLFHLSVLVLILMAFFRSRISFGLLLLVFAIPLSYILSINFEFGAYEFVVSKLQAYQRAGDLNTIYGLLKHLVLSLAFLGLLFFKKQKFDRDLYLAVFFMVVILTFVIISVKLTSRLLFLFDWWAVFLMSEESIRKSNARIRMGSV